MRGRNLLIEHLNHLFGGVYLAKQRLMEHTRFSAVYALPHRYACIAAYGVIVQRVLSPLLSVRPHHGVLLVYSGLMGFGRIDLVHSMLARRTLLGWSIDR